MFRSRKSKLVPPITKAAMTNSSGGLSLFHLQKAGLFQTTTANLYPSRSPNSRDDSQFNHRSLAGRAYMSGKASSDLRRTNKEPAKRSSAPRSGRSCDSRTGAKRL